MLKGVLKVFYLFTYLFAVLFVVHYILDQVIALFLLREYLDVLLVSGNVGEQLVVNVTLHLKNVLHELV